MLQSELREHYDKQGIWTSFYSDLREREPHNCPITDQGTTLLANQRAENWLQFVFGDLYFKEGKIAPSNIVCESK